MAVKNRGEESRTLHRASLHLREDILGQSWRQAQGDLIPRDLHDSLDLVACYSTQQPYSESPCGVLFRASVQALGDQVHIFSLQ